MFFLVLIQNVLHTVKGLYHHELQTHLREILEYTKIGEIIERRRDLKLHSFVFV